MEKIGKNNILNNYIVIIIDILKKYYVYIISFSIYSYFFCKLGNTCFRKNSHGIEKFSFEPLFTEGIIGPIRTIYLLLTNGTYKQTYKYINFELKNLANPISTFLIVKYIDILIKHNKII
jgi:hypothetical protein